LPAFTLEIGDALGLQHGVLKLVAQVQAGQQLGAQGQQVFAEFLQFGALALEIGSTGFIRTLEFALEFQVAWAAFGDELASNEIALFQFS
jgi:hypothetical protein